ncbi:MAG: TauD/TfdA dioxygenase family protein [Novosphingobium sp.]
MALHFERTSAPVGVFVSGLDVRDMSKGDESELYRAFLEFGVLIFRGMKLDVAGHVRLAGLFGQLSDPHALEDLRLPEEPRITLLAANGGRPVAPDDPEADAVIGTIPWHADQMYTPRPNRGALLRAVIMPEKGGNTGWIDTHRLYCTLPYKVKCRIQGLRIVHSYDTAHKVQTMVKGGAGQFPPTLHPLIVVHPETDRPALNIGPATATSLEGLPEGESEELLEHLLAFSTREEEAYIHEWEPGDLVAWDNLRTIHRAYGHPKRYPRLVHSLALKPELTLGRMIGG